MKNSVTVEQKITFKQTAWKLANFPNTCLSDPKKYRIF